MTDFTKAAKGETWRRDTGLGLEGKQVKHLRGGDSDRVGKDKGQRQGDIQER